jgi:hypothetical protein
MKQLALLKRIFEQSDRWKEVGDAEGKAVLQGLRDAMIAFFKRPL